MRRRSGGCCRNNTFQNRPDDLCSSVVSSGNNYPGHETVINQAQVMQSVALCAILLLACISSVAAFLPQHRMARGVAHELHAKTPLVAGGKRFEAEEGSSMLAACAKLGLKVPTKCKKGECGTCTVTAGGKKIRACIGKVPDAPRLKSLLEKGLVVTVDNA